VRVAIVGAGVAGSTLCSLLSRLDYKLAVYDITEKYVKPCGEVFPAKTAGIISENKIPKPEILNEINSFQFYVDKRGGIELVKSFYGRKVVWYSIDKSTWVDGLRGSCDKLSTKPINKPGRLYSDGYNLVIDARGPFSSKGTKIVVWRGYVNQYEDSAIFVFRSGALGFVWAFPHGDMINVGGGFVGVSDPRKYTINTLERILKNRNISIRDEKYSIITVSPKVELLRDRVVNVGEAAGLIMSLGGEGIRPAVVSAIKLFENVEKALSIVGSGGSFEEAFWGYARSLGGLIREVKTHNTLYRLASFWGGRFIERLLRGMSDSFAEEWLGGNLVGVMRSLGLYSMHRSSK